MTCIADRKLMQADLRNICRLLSFRIPASTTLSMHHTVHARLPSPHDRSESSQFETSCSWWARTCCRRMTRACSGCCLARCCCRTCSACPLQTQALPSAWQTLQRLVAGAFPNRCENSMLHCLVRWPRHGSGQKAEDSGPPPAPDRAVICRLCSSATQRRSRIAWRACAWH